MAVNNSTCRRGENRPNPVRASTYRSGPGNVPGLRRGHLAFPTRPSPLRYTQNSKNRCAAIVPSNTATPPAASIGIAPSLPGCGLHRFNSNAPIGPSGSRNNMGRLAGWRSRRRAAYGGNQHRRTVVGRSVLQELLHHNIKITGALTVAGTSFAPTSMPLTAASLAKRATRT